jgi:hypothetical protein
VSVPKLNKPYDKLGYYSNIKRLLPNLRLLRYRKNLRVKDLGSKYDKGRPTGRRAVEGQHAKTPQNENGKK